MSYSIRRAKETDVLFLNRMMFQLHEEHYQREPMTFKTASEITEEKNITRYLDDPHCLIYIAENNSGVIGFITGCFCELISPICKPITMATVDELYVVPHCRQQGVAQQLMQRIEKEFKDYGVKEMFIEVWHFNQRALDFYKKQGLKEHIHYLRKPVI